MLALIEIKALQWTLDHKPTSAAFDAKYGEAVRNGLAAAGLVKITGGNTALTKAGKAAFVAK